MVPALGVKNKKEIHFLNRMEYKNEMWPLYPHVLPQLTV
jgi:hypothetical protein